MDKIYHLTKRAKDAILKLVYDLDDKKIFGPSDSAAIAGFDEEREEIFGGYEESEDDDDKRCVFLIICHTYIHIYLTNLKQYFRCRK